MINLNIASGNNTGALLAQVENRLILAVHNNSNAFQVEQDFDNVLLNTFHCAVFVLNAINFNFRDGTTRHGRQQDATQGIAQCVTKATLQGLKSYLGSGFTLLIHLNHAGCEKFVHCTLHSFTCSEIIWSDNLLRVKLNNQMLVDL